MSTRPVSSRRLNSLLKRTGLSYGVRKHLVRWLQIAMRPGEYLLRKSRVRGLKTNLDVDYGLARRNGYLTIRSSDIQGFDALVSVCHDIYKERKPLAEQGLAQPGETYHCNLLQSGDYERYSEILEFVLSRDVLAVAGGYLGCVPRLGSVQLWWTPVNSGLTSSQKFHMDREDLSQAKFFVNLFDVTDESGPLTFIPAPLSRKIRQSLKYSEGKMTDDQVLGFCSETDYIKCVGGSDKVWVLDTSRCFHFGARARRKERLVLMFAFTTGYEMKEPVNNFPSGFDSWFEDDAIRRMIVSA